MKILQAGATASGDTTKTKVGSIIVPQGVKMIVGVGGHSVGGATLTSGECVSGLYEIESDDNQVVCRIPFVDADILTSGALAMGGVDRFVPTNIPVNPGATLSCYVTMDMAQTGALVTRIAVMFE